MIRISLVMATLGRVEEVRRCVRSLKAQSVLDFELIVVDQNEDDRLFGVFDDLSSAGVSVTHLRQTEKNQGLARNSGLRIAQGDLVAFPDDDCWYEENLIERVLDRFDEDHRLAAVVIRWEEQDRVGEAPRLLDPERWWNFREVCASMITQFYRRSVLIELGGFDHSFGLHSWFGGAEETELMFRVISLPDRCVAYEPHAVVHHRYIANPVEDDLKVALARTRSRSRGTGALYAKHRVSIYVLLRGLFSPIVLPIVKYRGIRALKYGLSTSIGRTEGYLGWKLGRR